MYILPSFCKPYRLQEVGFLFAKVVNFIRGITSYPTLLIIIAVGLFTLLYDGAKYKQKGYVREVRIIKIISYSYMAVGVLMFVLLLLM